jgi:hypothetical protein
MGGRAYSAAPMIDVASGQAILGREDCDVPSPRLGQQGVT